MRVFFPKESKSKKKFVGGVGGGGLGLVNFLTKKPILKKKKILGGGGRVGGGYELE